jgi:WD40 repeat protein
VYTNRNGEITGEKIFATAGDKYDKTVQLWDMTTLKNVATLKGHRGEIRALEFSKDGKYLFSAGMGGMLVWDTRNTQAPIELIEKHKDVFALKTTDSQLFMGCRDHSIVPMGLSYSELFQEQVRQPLKSPHLDVVTSFTTLLDDEILISASKDRNIRGWGIQQEASQDYLFKLPNLQLDQVHADHINVVRSSHDQQRMFSGSKDGIVAVWSVVGDPSDI